MGFDEGKFYYSPEVNYNRIDEKNSAEVAPLLEDFKKGYLVPLGAHIITADTFRQYLNSANVPQEFRSAINVKSEEIERELMQIVRLYSQVESRLETHGMNADAAHFFHSVFPGEESNEIKLNYLKMIRSYEHIRNFNRNTKENWEQLKTIFEVFKSIGNTKAFLEQILDFKIYPRIELCEKTDLLLRRLQYILKLPNDYETAKKINYAENYSSLLNYNLGTLFQQDLDKYIIFVDENKKESEEEISVDKNTCITDPYFLDSRGHMPFNVSYLYTLSINEVRVKSDTEKIQKSVYLETHLTIESKSLRQDMIRHFISSSGKSNNLAEYTDFLNEHFDFTREGILFHLQDSNLKEKILFMYHFGPVFFLKLLMQFLREGHTGYIHRFMGRHHMARELPFEFIKFTMKDWWDAHVFKLCNDAERNSRDYHNLLVTNFTHEWEQEQSRIYQAIMEDSLMTRAYHTRDYKTLRPFLEKELSFLFYCIFNRFLGTDFLYLPLNKPPRSLTQTTL
jgi:hypothetical protein